MNHTQRDSNSQQEIISDSLKDLKPSGKRRSWDKNKGFSMGVSQSYFLISELKRYGELIASCGSYLKFMACGIIEHGKRLIDANFCKARLCVMCQWRKSLVIRKQVLDLVHWHRERYSTDVPLLLTLTVVNVTGHELNKAIDRMNVAWRRLMQLKVVKRAVRSWFKSLEITYNSERQDFHPHFHALLMVPESYFKRSREFYIPHEEWLRLWRKSMRDDRITQVDIRKIKPRKEGELECLAAEVAKYATKPQSYIFENSEGELEASPEVVKELHYALKGRRLIGFGGLFNEIRKERKMVDVENADLVQIEEDETLCACKICGSTLLEELYRWDFGVRQYRKVPEEIAQS
jgi:plasmid rolling circle replication initiator protein Rep